MVTKLLLVTYNRLNLTQQTLDNIFEVTKSPFEFIIVDNASSDGTVDYLKSFFNQKTVNDFYKGAKIFCNDKNLGIAVGRNQTLALAGDAPWYATLDNDVLLPDNWLEKCTQIMTIEPKFGMMGVNFEQTRYPLIDVGPYKVQNKKQGNLGTACMVFSKKVQKMIGYFNDRDYGLYGLEDADYGVRARAVGFQLGYLEEQGVHLGEDANDQGEYRKFKTEEHNRYLKIFYNNCNLYFRGGKTPYLSIDKSKYIFTDVMVFS